MIPSPNRHLSLRPAVAGSALLVATALLAACTSSSVSSPAAGSGSPSSNPSESPSASVSTPPLPASYLSGRPGGKNGKILVVKLDNTPRSEPHAGLMSADVIYLEEVEGGLSRYAAVFSSAYPKTVGPIRSARITDIELLRQYGRVAFAYSGAQAKMLPVLAAANISNVSDDSGGLGYRRDYGWRPPDNLFADPAVLFGRARNVAVARDIGFRFSSDVPAGGRAAAKVTSAFPAARITFTWSLAKKRWLVARDGSPSMAVEGGQLGGTTVIIQYVTVTRSIYRDVLGNYTPFSSTVGTGKALMLRDGKAYGISWSRPSASSGTRWTVGGKDIALAPGQVWIVLMNKTRPATIS